MTQGQALMGGITAKTQGKNIPGGRRILCATGKQLGPSERQEGHHVAGASGLVGSPHGWR